MNQFLQLRDWAFSRCLPELLPHTRVHPFNGQGGTNWYVKREDETGISTSGGKMRKMASLLHHFRAFGYRTLYFEAGWQSNNAISMFSICKERGIPCKMVAPKINQDQGEWKGNGLLLRILARPEEIIPLANESSFAEFQATFSLDHPDQPILWVPEGGDCEAALPGTITLLADILQNEAESQRIFGPVWVDAGTGMTAIGLILANAFLPNPKTINVVGMADDEALFLKKLDRYTTYIERETGLSLPKASQYIAYHRPFSGKSFGSVNTTVIQKSLEIARETGLLLDPIYMAKLMGTALELAPQNLPSETTTLIINSGGSASILGLADQYTKVIKSME